MFQKSKPYTTVSLQTVDKSDQIIMQLLGETDLL